MKFGIIVNTNLPHSFHLEIPFVEIHLTNIHKREEFRHHSYFSDIAIGALAGLGVKGYLLAAEFAVDFIKQKGKNHSGS